MWSSSSSSFVRPFFFAANSMHIYAGVPISFYKHTLSLSQTIIFPLAAIRFILLFPYWVSVCVFFISFCCSYRSIDPSAPNLYFLSMMTTSAIVFFNPMRAVYGSYFIPFLLLLLLLLIAGLLKYSRPLLLLWPGEKTSYGSNRQTQPTFPRIIPNIPLYSLTRA